MAGDFFRAAGALAVARFAAGCLAAVAPAFFAGAFFFAPVWLALAGVAAAALLVVFFTDSLLLVFEAVLLPDPAVPLVAVVAAFLAAAFFIGAFFLAADRDAGDLVVAVFFAAACFCPEAPDLPLAEDVAGVFRLAVLADALRVLARPLLEVFAAALLRDLPPDLSPDFAAM